jgi:hypothetical protein
MDATEGRVSGESRGSHTTEAWQEAFSGRPGTPRNTTLLDLVTAVSADAETEAELIATVVRLVNSGVVRLCGTFKGARFDVESEPTRYPLSA